MVKGCNIIVKPIRASCKWQVVDVVENVLVAF
jgi:hypothetical protein